MIRKLSPTSAAILAFEKSRKITSQLYYLQRLPLYLLLATAVGVAEQQYQIATVGATLKGILFGACLGSIGIGLLLGCMNGVAFKASAEILSDFI